jgi:hypothetical protein
MSYYCNILPFNENYRQEIQKQLLSITSAERNFSDKDFKYIENLLQIFEI